MLNSFMYRNPLFRFITFVAAFGLIIFWKLNLLDLELEDIDGSFAQKN